MAREALKLSSNKRVVFTGHSLGGGLAIYEAVVHRQTARGFSAADPMHMLSPEQLETAEKLRKKGMLVDYRNKQDIITGSTNRITDGWKPDAVALTIWCANDGIFRKGPTGGWDGHGLQYYRFSANGDIDALTYQPELYTAINGSLSADYESLEQGRQDCLKAIAYLENLKKVNNSIPARMKEAYDENRNNTGMYDAFGLFTAEELDGIAHERGVYYTQVYSQAAVDESGRKIEVALKQLHKAADTARKAIMEFSGLDSRLAALGARYMPAKITKETTIKQNQ